MNSSTKAASHVGIKFPLVWAGVRNVKVFDGYRNVDIPRTIMRNVSTSQSMVTASVPLRFARRVGWIR